MVVGRPRDLARRDWVAGVVAPLGCCSGTLMVAWATFGLMSE